MTASPHSDSAAALEPARRDPLFAAAINDLVGGLGRWRLWTALAWEDLKATYRRSVIGVLWISLSFAVFVAVKVLIFGSFVQGREIEYFGAYLMLGFFCWVFFTQIVTGAPSVFVTAESWIRNDPIELSVFAYQGVVRSMFDLAFTGITAAGFYLYFGQGADWTALLVIPALALYILNAIWVMLLLGIICARFRDLTHLINTIMRVMLFLTPILWLPEQLGEQIMQYLWWNPFAHFIWILRTPLLDGMLATESWIFVGVITVLGWSSAFIVFALFRRRVVFWL